MASAKMVDADTVGKFLLGLYHRNIISQQNDWTIAKEMLHEKYRQYMNVPKNGRRNPNSKKVEVLLMGSEYIRSLDNMHYRIRKEIVFQYSIRLVKKLDDQRKCQQIVQSRQEQGARANSANSGNSGNSGNPGNPGNNDQPINMFEVDDRDPWEPLSFSAGDLHLRKRTFQKTNIACFVCQINFDTLTIFEQHIARHHRVANKFSLLKETRITFCSWTSSRVILSYKQCKNSQFICFAIVPLTPHIVIENVIMVYPNAMKDLRNAWDPVPSPPGFNNYFYIDARLLPVGRELSIVVVFHYKFTDLLRMVEQHIFMRMNEFPLPKAMVRTNSLPNTRIFEPNHAMALYEPCINVLNALSSGDPIGFLSRISPQFNDYVNNGRTLNYYNMFHTLSILLQMEDVATLSSYFNLTQYVNRLTKDNNGKYTVQLNVSPRLYVENVIFPYDEVVIIGNRGICIVEHMLPLTAMLMEKNVMDSLNGRERLIYFGRVVASNVERVTFVCHQPIPENESFMLLFRSNRRAMRQQFSAIEMLLKAPPALVMRYLYPIAAPNYAPLPNIRLNLLNTKIADDPNQLNAVRVIATREAHFNEVPFIIFGPAGSGKTTTIVEAILQLYHRAPTTKILVTASANSACNELALCLLTAMANYNDRRGCVRIFARSNEKRTEYIDKLILKNSNIFQSHFYPAIEVLHEYRIVICTLSVVAALRSGRFGANGQLTHIFVDEAAASTQMETLAALVGIMSPTTSLIVSGDHKQLNQMMHSRYAMALGLDISLMERLLVNNCYYVDNFGNYDRRVQTRLRNNYRSHPAIVNLFSRMFYNGELVPLASNDVLHVSKNWHRCMNRDYPIMFHSVIGYEEHNEQSPSSHNMRELQVIMDYIKELMFFGIKGKAINQSDIGIISPYREQCGFITKELAKRQWCGIESGTVEMFQGREKHIMIVSFVRTSSLGFLHNTRRLNVILSRARSMLILIGNPLLLASNNEFKFIINECRRHKTLVGAKFDHRMCIFSPLE